MIADPKREIGEGGCGVVYVAEQTKPVRPRGTAAPGEAPGEKSKVDRTQENRSEIELS